MRLTSIKGLLVVVLGILLITGAFADSAPYDLESLISQPPLFEDGLKNIEFVTDTNSPSTTTDGSLSFITDRQLDPTDQIFVTLPRYSGFGVFAALFVDNQQRYPQRPVQNFGGFPPSIVQTPLDLFNPGWPWDTQLIDDSALRLAIPLGGASIAAGSIIRIEFGQLITPPLDLLPPVCKVGDYGSDDECCNNLFVGVMNKLLSVITRHPILKCPQFPDWGQQNQIPSICFPQNPDAPFDATQQRICCQYSYFANIETGEVDPRCLEQYCLRRNAAQEEGRLPGTTYDTRCCAYQSPLDYTIHPQCPECTPGNFEMNICCLNEALRATVQCAGVVCTCDEWTPEICCPFPEYRNNQWAIPGACDESCENPAYFQANIRYCCTYFPQFNEQVCLCENGVFDPTVCCELPEYIDTPACRDEDCEIPEECDECDEEEIEPCCCSNGGCGCEDPNPDLPDCLRNRYDRLIEIHDMDVRNIDSGENTEIYDHDDIDRFIGPGDKRIVLDITSGRSNSTNPPGGGGGIIPPPPPPPPLTKLIGLPIRMAVVILNKGVSLLSSELSSLESAIGSTLRQGSPFPSPFRVQTQHQFIAIINGAGDLEMVGDNIRHLNPRLILSAQQQKRIATLAATEGGASDSEHAVIVYSVTSRGVHQDDMLEHANESVARLQSAIAANTGVIDKKNIVIENSALAVEDVERCNDGEKNGEETDVDCGGSVCTACGIGKTCEVNRDCASQICSEDKTCAAFKNSSANPHGPFWLTVTMTTAFAGILAGFAFMIFA